MNALETLPANLMIGLETAFSLSNLMYCLIGAVLGTLIGVIPGIGALAAISMLFPLTLYLEPTAALVMLPASITEPATAGRRHRYFSTFPARHPARSRPSTAIR